MPQAISCKRRTGSTHACTHTRTWTHTYTHTHIQIRAEGGSTIACSHSNAGQRLAPTLCASMGISTGMTCSCAEPRTNGASLCWRRKAGTAAPGHACWLLHRGCLWAHCARFVGPKGARACMECGRIVGPKGGNACGHQGGVSWNARGQTCAHGGPKVANACGHEYGVSVGSLLGPPPFIAGSSVRSPGGRATCCTHVVCLLCS